MDSIRFLDRLNSGEILVSDGATGSNFHARGLTQGTLSEAWLFEKPEEIVRLHLDFLTAGSDILLTNTFGASALRLEAGGLSGRVSEVNRKAVELARQAIEIHCKQLDANKTTRFVAGSIGPTGQLLKPYGPLEEEQVFSSFSQQAKALSEAGADFLLIESQFDMKEAQLAFQAAQSVSSLPIVVSFSYDQGTRSMMGVSPSQMAAEFGNSGAVMLGVNCGRSLDENLEALRELYSATKLPIWFKPNAGIPQTDSQGFPIYSVTPEEMGGMAVDWLAAGARVVGGCCGTSPEHLAQIARAVGSARKTEK